MCVGEDCPIKKDCYRYRAIPKLRQSYFMAPPREGNECRYFWQLEAQHRIRCMDEIPDFNNVRQKKGDEDGEIHGSKGEDIGEHS